MSTGFQGKFYRQNILSTFGKELVRRSRSRCELCERSGVRLIVLEVPPQKEEPLVDECVFVCEMCRKQIENPKKIIPSHWRCLNHSLWSEIPAVQVVSYRMLTHLASRERWAEELLENAYLDPETEAWAKKTEKT
jgi:protein PhnA